MGGVATVPKSEKITETVTLRVCACVHLSILFTSDHFRKLMMMDFEQHRID